MKKSILITVTNDLNNDQRMQRIAETLQTAGYSVLLLGRNKRNSKALNPHVFDQKRLSCFFESGKLFYLEYNLRLFVFSLFHSFVIHYAVDLDTLLPLSTTAILKGKKLCFDAHEYFTEVPEVTNRPITKKIWDWVARFGIPKSDLNITVGPALADQLQHHYRSKFEVVRNVPKLKNAKYDWPDILPFPEQKFLLYQGALNKGRGIEQLLEVMQQVDYPLVIAGEGDLSKDLRRMAKDLKVESKVYFLGMLSPLDLDEVTQHAYLGFNLLEHLGESYYYSLANKFFDYIQAQVPCITMDFPEYRAINDKFNVAVLISNLTKENILNAIDTFAENPEYYVELQSNAKLAAVHYNWNEEAQHLLSLINGISR